MSQSKRSILFRGKDRNTEDLKIPKLLSSFHFSGIWKQVNLTFRGKYILFLSDWASGYFISQCMHTPSHTLKILITHKYSKAPESEQTPDKSTEQKLGLFLDNTFRRSSPWQPLGLVWKPWCNLQSRQLTVVLWVLC